jgi:WD40 repeat protein
MNTFPKNSPWIRAENGWVLQPQTGYGGVNPVAFSPDGNRILTRADHSVLHLWDAVTGVELQQFEGHPPAVFSPDGQHVLMLKLAQSGSIPCLREIASGKELLRIEGHARPTNMVFSPNGRYVATTSYAAINLQGEVSVCLWEIANGKARLLLERKEGCQYGEKSPTIAFSADSSRLFACFNKMAACLWNVATGKMRVQLKWDGFQRAIFSSDGLLVFTFNDQSDTLGDTPCFWDAITGEKRMSLKNISPEINKLARVPFHFMRKIREGRSHAEIFMEYVKEGKIIEFVSDQRQFVYLTRKEYSEEEIKANKKDSIGVALKKSYLRSIRRHEEGNDAIVAADFSPDGRRLVAVYKTSTYHEIVVWGTATGHECLHLQFKESFRSFTFVAFSPEGSRILLKDEKDVIRLFDAITGEEFPQPGEGYCIFSPDGQNLLMEAKSRVMDAENNAARLWNIATGQETLRLSGHAAGDVYNMVFSPDRSSVLVLQHGATTLWDTATGREISRLERTPGRCGEVCFLPDGQHIQITCSGAPWNVHVYDAASGKERQKMEFPATELRVENNPVAFSPNGRQVAGIGREKIIALLDKTTGKTLLRMEGYTEEMLPDKKIVSAPKDLHRLAGRVRNIASLAFSPDGQYISAGIEHWACDWSDFKKHGGGPLYLLSGSSDCFIHTWDAKTGKTVWRQEIYNCVVYYLFSIRTLIFSPDSQRILAVSRDTVFLLDVGTGEKLLQWEGSSATFSPDGKLIYTASRNNALYVWNATTGEKLLQLEGTSAIFSSDCKLILTISHNHAVYVWNTTTGEKLLQLEGTAAAFSPDGKLILTVDCGLLRLWNAETGTERYRIQPYRDGWFVLYPDGHYRCGGVERLALVRNGAESRPVDAEFEARWRLES